jgi:tight adherence protein B
MVSLVAAIALSGSMLVSRRPTSPTRRLPHTLAPGGGDDIIPAHWWRRRRHAQRHEAEVVEVVFALAAEMRAGRPPGRALALVSASAGLLQTSLAEAAGAVDAGASPADELVRVAELPGCAGLRAVAAAWAVTEAAGGAVADVLDRLGEVLDCDRQARDELDAALAGPRATMTLLAGLPILGLVLGESLGADPLELLVHRPLGWALTATGLALDAIGMVWMRLLVRRALR